MLAPLAELLPRLQHDPQSLQRVVIATPQGDMTAEQLVQRVAALSARIRQHDGARWLLWLPAFDDFVVALFAVWHAGRTPVLPPNFQPEMAVELEGAFDAVLTVNTDIATAKPCVMVDAHDRLSQLLQPFDAAAQLVLYTSGSTDRPKPVGKKLHQLQSEITVLEQLWGTACAGKPVVATVPHHHIYGLLFRVLWPLAAGRVTVAAVAATPTELSCVWEARGQCVLVSSPTHLSRLPDLVDLPDWAGRYAAVFSSGAPFAETPARQIAADWAVPVQEIYGSSETGGIAWRHAAQPGYPCWTPLPGVSVRPSAEDTLEIVSLFLPELQPFVTADRVEFAAHGTFRLGGRIDRVVKIEGKRASLEQIEALLRRHAWVKEVAVIPLQQPRQCLAAVVVPSGEGKIALMRGRAPVAQHFRRFVNESVDRVLVPRRWRFVEQLPRDERGKLPLDVLERLFDTEASL
ncbi:MAG: acyl-CoA synthetase [Burkholderiaceae bacterium]|nr:MAG: acyl-CoA synthetase [Burkholderiaceae bacterium]